MRVSETVAVMVVLALGLWMFYDIGYKFGARSCIVGDPTNYRYDTDVPHVSPSSGRLR